MHAERHQRVVERDDAVRPLKVPLHVFRRAVEFFDLVILSDVRFDHAHRLHVFLDGLVDRVVLFKYAREPRIGNPDDRRQRRHQHGDDDEIDHGHLRADGDAHHQREDKHQRAADRDADNHLKGVLHVGDVRRHTGHQRGRGELVDVCKGKFLNLIIEVVAEISREPRRGDRRVFPRQEPARQRDRRHYDENPAVHDDLPEQIGRSRLCGIDRIDHQRHDVRDQTLHHNFERNEDGRQNGRLFVLPHALQQCFYHTFYSKFLLNFSNNAERVFFSSSVNPSVSESSTPLIAAITSSCRRRPFSVSSSFLRRASRSTGTRLM